MYFRYVFHTINIRLILVLIVKVLTLNSLHSTRHDLVENVVRSFKGLLGNDTSFLQQICNVSSKYYFSRQISQGTVESLKKVSSLKFKDQSTKH